ncbi:MAG: terminase family protein [Akkermansiaceae bacterium]|nr:terminase family protein [Akkermansiaceae bacterium]
MKLSTAQKALVAKLSARIEWLRGRLLPYQRRWVKNTARFLCGVWARQTGKSFCTAFIVAVSLVTTAKTTWMIAAPSERQSMEALAKVKEWVAALQVQVAEGVEALQGVNAKAGCIELANGSRCIAVPGKPDTVRGMSANVWLDEFAFFENPDATWKAILPSITNPLRGGEKRVIITSTPNGRGGVGKRFYDIAHSTPKPNMAWSVQRVTLRDAIADGLPVDYDALVEGMDDALAAAQELGCEFLDGTQTLLPYDVIALAESFTEASEAAEPELWKGKRDLRLGIDFGRTNDPTVCWTLEKLGDVLYTREVLVLRDMPTPQQEDILRTRIRAARRVCFDYTGPGIGLGDYMAKEFGIFDPAKHSFGRLELCTFTASFKRDIFPKLRRAFEAPTRLRIPSSPDIREDLHAMQQIIHNGQYSYAAPHTAEGHSDRCTALALALRAAEGAQCHHIGVVRTRGVERKGWQARARGKKAKSISANMALRNSYL